MSDYTRLVEVLSLNNKLAAENEALQKRYLSALDLFGKCQEREQQIQSKLNKARELTAKLHTSQCIGTVVNTSALSELRSLFKSEDESPVVLPERMVVPCGDLQPFERAEAIKWNACIDEFKRLNK